MQVMQPSLADSRLQRLCISTSSAIMINLDLILVAPLLRELDVRTNGILNLFDEPWTMEHWAAKACRIDFAFQNIYPSDWEQRLRSLNFEATISKTGPYRIRVSSPAPQRGGLYIDDAGDSSIPLLDKVQRLNPDEQISEMCDLYNQYVSTL